MTGNSPVAPRIAFYDLDGTLVATNVVDQYLWFAKRVGGLATAWRVSKLALSVPLYLAVDRASRLAFNRLFYASYRGLGENWLRANAGAMFAAIMEPAIFPSARALIARDRSEGFHTVLLTGSLDFAIAPVANALGIDEVLANRLEFRSGVATGQLLDPILAGDAKVDALAACCRRRGVLAADCRAYSDSMSDLPMLQAVGQPAAANPDSRLRSFAAANRWPILDLRAPLAEASS